MTDFIINARYEPKMDKRQRINAALERSGVRLGAPMPGMMLNGQEGRCFYSDVNWNSNRNGTGTELEIYAGTDPMRASRLAAELRACGMVVHVDARNQRGGGGMSEMPADEFSRRVAAFQDGIDRQVTIPTMYIRNDGVEMIEVAPSQAVNVPAALKLHLVTLEVVEAARRKMNQREAV